MKQSLVAIMKMGNFLMVPNELLNCRGLSSGAKNLYMFLSNQNKMPSRRETCSRLGIGPNQYISYLTELVQFGFLNYCGLLGNPGNKFEINLVREEWGVERKNLRFEKDKTFAENMAPIIEDELVPNQYQNTGTDSVPDWYRTSTNSGTDSVPGILIDKIPFKIKNKDVEKVGRGSGLNAGPTPGVQRELPLKTLIHGDREAFFVTPRQRALSAEQIFEGLSASLKSPYANQG